MNDDLGLLVYDIVGGGGQVIRRDASLDLGIRDNEVFQLAPNMVGYKNMAQYQYLVN